MDLKSCVLYGHSRPRLILSAPSISALRTIVARYMELCTYAFLDVSSLPQHEIVALGRDLVANIHSCTLDDFPTAFRLCKEYFRDMSSHALRGDYRLMPNPVMFYLQQPWIDRIRNLQRSPLTRIEYSHEEKFMLQPNFLHHMSYTLPECPILVKSEECSCITQPRSYALHWECYYQITGNLSKSSYKFLEIILTYNLPVMGVMCLGTSTGSEAAAITRLKENKYVYVNCFHKLSSFAPHSAATYLPPSFLSEGDPNKLVSPSSSALGTNDLTDPECVESILSHIRPDDYTGITCDAEIPDSSSDVVFRQILNTILILCDHSPNCEWVIIKLPIKCPHSIQAYLSDLTRLFLQCDIVYSSFNRQKARNFHFIAQRRRPSLLPRPDDQDVVLTLSDHDKWRRILTDVDYQEFPACFMIGSKQMALKVRACNVSPSSLNAACFHYIRGWGGGYTQGVTVNAVVTDLLLLMEMVHRELLRVLLITYRALTGLPMIRAGILEQSDTPIQRQINEICYVFLQAKLMVKILQKNSRDFYLINDFIFKFLGTNHRIPLRSSDLYVTIDQSRFVAKSSRYLFELLGHLYRCEPIETFSNKPPVVHQSKRYHNAWIVPIDDFMNVKLTNIRAHPDHSWKWLKRCFIMSIYLIHFDGYSAVKGLCRYNHLLSSPTAYRMQIHKYYTPEPDINAATYLWVETRQQLLKESFRTPIWLVYDSNLFHDVTETFEVATTKALPWSGVVPSKLLSLCLKRVQSRAVYRFVDVMDISHRVNTLGTCFAGCSCYSCTVEVILTKSFNLSSADLDVLCSGLHLTNVLYKYHSSTD